jgi:hypothetical protein
VVEIVDVIGDDHHDPDELSVLADHLAAVSAVAAEEDSHEAISMAVVELITGLHLDDAILARKWPVIEFRMREAPQPSAPRNGVGASDAELAIALEVATPEARLAAQTQLVETVISLNGLTDEPAVVALVDQLRRGMTPGPSAELFELHARLDAAYPRPASGDIGWSDPVWRRRKAGDLLFALAIPDRAGSAMRFNGWLQASFALEAAWPDARAIALRTLRSSGPFSS